MQLKLISDDHIQGLHCRIKKWEEKYGNEENKVMRKEDGRKKGLKEGKKEGNKEKKEGKKKERK